MHVVTGHMGTALHATRAINLAKKYENIYLETSVQQSPERIRLGIEKLGEKRLLFGSGSPYGNLKFELSKIEAAVLNRETLEFLLWKNAERLLNHD